MAKNCTNTEVSPITQTFNNQHTNNTPTPSHTENEKAEYPYKSNEKSFTNINSQFPEINVEHNIPIELSRTPVPPTHESTNKRPHSQTSATDSQTGTPLITKKKPNIVNDKEHAVTHIEPTKNLTDNQNNTVVPTPQTEIPDEMDKKTLQS